MELVVFVHFCCVDLMLLMNSWNSQAFLGHRARNMSLDFSQITCITACSPIGKAELWTVAKTFNKGMLCWREKRSLTPCYRLFAQLQGEDRLLTLVQTCVSRQITYTQKKLNFSKNRDVLIQLNKKSHHPHQLAPASLTRLKSCSYLFSCRPEMLVILCD